jgi:hypothetical protein
MTCQTKHEKKEKENRLMKKICSSVSRGFVVLLLSLVMLATAPGLALAVDHVAGTCIQTLTQYGISASMSVGNPIVSLKFTCTADNEDGTIPNQTVTTANMNKLKGQYFLYLVSAYPVTGESAVAPDAADVLILDAAGFDLLGSTDGSTAVKGAGLIDATLKKTVAPYLSSAPAWYFPPIMSTLTLVVSGQATHSATYVVELTFGKFGGFIPVSLPQ